MIHLNIRSLLPKLDELKFYLSNNNRIQILSLNETWLNSSVDNEEVAIPGFMLFRRDRPTDSHGGVALYVRSELQPVLIPELSDSTVESVFVKIKVGNSVLIIGSLYRPPNAKVAYFEALKYQFEKCSNLNLCTILMGDFNININDENKVILILLYQFKHLINTHTRVTSKSATTIDLIFIIWKINILIQVLFLWVLAIILQLLLQFHGNNEKFKTNIL